MSSKFEELTKAREFMSLPPLITLRELKKRYKELSKELHPDKGGSLEMMQKLSESYKMLNDYIENFRFKFSEEEIAGQFPYDSYKKRFRF